MESCCRTGVIPEPGRCPECGQKGRPVGSVTLDHLLEPSARELLPAGTAFYFCPTATCDAVYHAAGALRFHQRDLTVRVGLKVREHPVPVCYCFGYTERDIAEQVATTGRSTIAGEVTAKVKAGECECEIRNPQGSCCLGNIAVATRRIMATRPETSRTS